MTIHKPTIFFVYGLLTGLAIMWLRPALGLWSCALLAPAVAIGVWLDVKTKQHGGWH